MDTKIDWEQRRYELAKSAMQGILSNQDQIIYACFEERRVREAKGIKDGIITPNVIAKYAVACADSLIAELKK